jgi:preprotein translocase subunit SecE
VAFLDKMKRSFGTTFSFFGDAWSELKKVKWPTRKEMTTYTMVVMGTVFFIALYFYVLDLGISELIRLVTE